MEKTEIGGECIKGGSVGGRILLEKIFFLMSKCLCFICCTLSTLVLRMLLLQKVLNDLFFNEYYVNCQYSVECLKN